MDERVTHGYIAEEIPNVPFGKCVRFPKITEDRCAELYAAIAESSGSYKGKSAGYWKHRARVLERKEKRLSTKWHTLLDKGFNAVMFEDYNSLFTIITPKEDGFRRYVFDHHGPLSDRVITTDEIVQINSDRVWVC
jgi:hypothetical protein